MRTSRSEFLQILASGFRLARHLRLREALRPPVDGAARPLPLTAVRLTGGPLKHAQDLNAKYLL